MVASKFQKGDYRRHGPLTAKPTTFRALGKKNGYSEPASGPNRHERRKANHFREIRKNTLGVPQGFNCTTWNARCQEIALELRDSDASKGTPNGKRGDKKRYRRSTDVLKGISGANQLRKMFRAGGLKETLILMHGAHRGVKRHPGYATMGAYDKTGGKLASPRGKA